MLASATLCAIDLGDSHMRIKGIFYIVAALSVFCSVSVNANQPSRIPDLSILNLSCVSPKYSDRQEFFSINFSAQTVNRQKVYLLEKTPNEINWVQFRMHPRYPTDTKKAEITSHKINRFTGVYSSSISPSPERWDAVIPLPYTTFRCSVVSKRKF